MNWDCVAYYISWFGQWSQWAGDKTFYGMTWVAMKIAENCV